MWTLLPDTLVRSIAAFVPIKDLLHWNLVSKSVASAIDEGVVVASFSAYVYKARAAKGWADLLSDHGKHVKRVRLTCERDHMAIRILRAVPNADEIDCSLSCKDDSDIFATEALSTRTTPIKALTLSNVLGLEAVTDAIKTNRAQLQTLWLTSVEEGDALTDFQPDATESLVTLVCTPRLRVLKLNGAHMTIDALVTVWKQATELVEFDWSGYIQEGETYHTLDEWARVSAPPKLAKLSIEIDNTHEDRAFPVEALVSLTETKTPLQSLSLYHTTPFSNAHIGRMMRHHTTKLKAFEVHVSRQFSLQDALDVNSCPLLEYVRFMGPKGCEKTKELSRWPEWRKAHPLFGGGTAVPP